MSDSLALVLQQAIRAERARLGLSQAQLGERVGWSPTRVAAIESGSRRIYAHELPDICEALETPLAELIRRANERDRRWLSTDIP